jgi:hypothetical protein
VEVEPGCSSGCPSNGLARRCAGAFSLVGRVEATGIEPTNLLHAMQILECPGCGFGSLALASVMLCSFQKPFRSRGFFVHVVSRGLGSSSVSPLSPGTQDRGKWLRCWLRREAEFHT